MNVIELTRLRHGESFYVNPDLLERVDTHVDTVIRLTTGSEYMVSETGEEIVRRIADFRARTLALAGLFQQAAEAARTADGVWTDDAGADPEPAAELALVRNDDTAAPDETAHEPAPQVDADFWADDQVGGRA